MSHVYVSASLKEEAAVRMLYAELRARGHEVTYDWVTSQEQDRPALAEDEIQGVISSDAVIFLYPGGRGAHCELGAALAYGVPVLFCYTDANKPKPSLFYYHELVRWTWFDDASPASVVDAAERMLKDGV